MYHLPVRREWGVVAPPPIVAIVVAWGNIISYLGAVRTRPTRGKQWESYIEMCDHIAKPFSPMMPSIAWGVAPRQKRKLLSALGNIHFVCGGTPQGGDGLCNPPPHHHHNLTSNLPSPDRAPPEESKPEE